MLTLGVQLFLTARVVVVLGVALTLGILPVLTIVGFGVLALVPTVMAIAVFQVLRRAADYAIARPARLAVIPLAALWLVNALWLGRRQERLAARQAAAPPAHDAVV